MAPKPSLPRRTTVDVMRVPTPEIDVYSNTMTVTGGAFDIALDFGRRVGDEAATALVRVNMSYEHLASMVRVLSNVVEQYSEQFGPLPDPEAIIATQEAGDETDGAS